MDCAGKLTSLSLSSFIWSLGTDNCIGMVGFSREGSGGWKSSRDCGNACVRYLSDAIASGASTAWCYTRATFASCRIGYEAVPYFPNNDCGPFNQPGYT